MAGGGEPLKVFLVRGIVSMIRAKRPWEIGSFYRQSSDKTDPGHYFLISPPHLQDQLRHAYEAGQQNNCNFPEWQLREEREALKARPQGPARRA